MLKTLTAISVFTLCATTSVFAADACQNPFTTSSAELTALESDKRAAEIRRMVDCTIQAATETQNRLSSISAVQFDQMINTLIDERAALQKLYDDRKQAIGQLENDLVSRVIERDDALARVKLLEGQLADAQDKLAVLTAEREKLNAIIAENAMTIQQLQKDVERLQSENSALGDSLNAAKTDNQAKIKTIADLQKTLDDTLAETKDWQARLLDQEKQIASAKSRIEELEGALSKSESARKESDARLTEAQSTIAKLTAERDRLSADMANLTATKAELEKQLATMRTEKANLLSDLIRIQAENDKLKDQVDALSAVRSEFFAKLREKLKDQRNVHIVGDRFIIQSEVLFDVGSPDLNPRGVAQMREVAHLLKDLSGSFPQNIHWVLQVNGHTDIQKIAPGGKFASNWELSTARALTVVKLMQAEGVSPKNLVAAGFGEYQPVDEGKTPESFAKNRRIELKLTDDGPYKFQ